MKAQRIKRYLIVLLLLGFSGSGGAAPYPNPFPGIWGDDIDGNGLFNPGNLTFSAEIFALPEIISSGFTDSRQAHNSLLFRSRAASLPHAAYSSEHRLSHAMYDRLDGLIKISNVHSFGIGIENTSCLLQFGDIVMDQNGQPIMGVSDSSA